MKPEQIESLEYLGTRLEQSKLKPRRTAKEWQNLIKAWQEM